MVLVAFGLRLAVMGFVYQQSLNPRFDHWFFGFEEGRVARSIATGHGFGNPLWGRSGPTAWYAPVYPYLLAADFKVFGIFTKEACLAILSFQSLVSALVCLPLFFFARRNFGEGAALTGGWVWAFYPYAVYWPVIRIWETWLATLLLAILFCAILKLRWTSRKWAWAGFGLLAGLAALADPVVLAALVPLALWALWKRGREGAAWFGPTTVALLCGFLVISPWMIRNAIVFHKFIPIRDDLALEFRVGNSGKTLETMDLLAGPWLPWVSDSEWKDYGRMGEIAYFQWKGEEAKAQIEAHPLWYAGMCVRRVAYLWTGFWSLNKRYRDEQTLDTAAICLLTLLTVLMLMGLHRAFKEKGDRVAAPYAIVLFFFPLIYYLTHVERWYRCPVGPFIIVLASYEVHARAAAWLRHRRAIRVAYQVPETALLPSVISREDVSAMPRIDTNSQQPRAR